MNVLASLFLISRRARTLGVLFLILSSIAILMAININNPFVEQIEELQKQLITTSGIFTALILAILVPKFSEKRAERLLLISQYKKDCKKVAAFRAFIHKFKYFDLFKDPRGLRRTYLYNRSFRDYKNSYQFQLELEQRLHREEIIPEDIGKMEFYGAIRDFSYEAASGGISFFSKYGEYTYSLEKLEMLHDCCQSMWSSLDRLEYIREGVNRSFSQQSTYSTDRMNELVPFFSATKSKIPITNLTDFIRKETSEYEQILSTMTGNLLRILYDLSPKNFSFLAHDTSFILIFVLLIPLYTLLFKFNPIVSILIAITCFSTTATFVINFLFDVYRLFNTDNFRDEYEEDKYVIYPQEPYN